MQRKTFSFTDEKVLKHLDGMEKGEMSRYVQRLIREDIKGGRDTVTKEDVVRMIREYGVRIDDVPKKKEDKEIRSAVKNMLGITG
jgi:hypothetical protein